MVLKIDKIDHKKYMAFQIERDGVSFYQRDLVEEQMNEDMRIIKKPKVHKVVIKERAQCLIYFECHKMSLGNPCRSYNELNDKVPWCGGHTRSTTNTSRGCQVFISCVGKLNSNKNT